MWPKRLFKMPKEWSKSSGQKGVVKKEWSKGVVKNEWSKTSGQKRVVKKVRGECPSTQCKDAK